MVGLVGVNTSVVLTVPLLVLAVVAAVGMAVDPVVVIVVPAERFDRFPFFSFC